MEYPKAFDFNYKRVKFSSGLHHSFLPDFSFPFCFSPLYFTLLIFARTRKMKKEI